MDIGILNYNNSKYMIIQPSDIYWYKERYDFNLVMLIEEQPTDNREMLYSICNELSLLPIYGLRLNVRLSEYADKTIEVLVIPKRINEDDTVSFLSDKGHDGEITLDDLLQCRSQLWIGLTLGENYIDIGSIYGVCRFIVKPDFVFVRYDVMQSDYYDDYSDGAFYYLNESDIITIPYLTQNKHENWRYIFDDIAYVDKKSREQFITLISSNTEK